MAKKKAGKEIKRLKQKAKKATAANLRLEKQVQKLKQELDARELQITDLQSQLSKAPQVVAVTDSRSAVFGDRVRGDIASSRRAAWKQHSYLRDRYEFHLDTGVAKDRARLLANEDLKQEYGKDCGFTAEELSAILS